MKKFLIIIFTIFFAYILSYYTTDAHKKQGLFDFGNSSLLYKLGTIISGETDTTDAYQVFQRGMEYLDYQKYDAAIKDFDKALELDYNFIIERGALYDYFNIYITAQDTVKQIDFIEKFLEIEPSNYDALNKLAEIHLLKGNKKEAEKYLQNSIRINSDYNNNGFYRLAQIKYFDEEYEEALSFITKSVNINSYMLEYYDLRRLIYTKLNKFELAKEDYDYILTQDASYFPDYFNKAKQEEKAKNYQAAIENYKLALTTQPNNKEILNKRAWAYITTKKYDSAYYDFDAVVKYYPDRASYFNKAYIQDFLDSIEQAITNYNIAISYEPTYYLSYMNRGYEYYRLKKYKKAKNDYTKSINLNPNYHQHYYNRGLLYSMQKKYKKAIADYKSALKNSPNNVNITYDIAFAYDKLKKKKETIQWFNDFLKLEGATNVRKRDHAKKRIKELSK